jgi:hypothetical protein
MKWVLITALVLVFLVFTSVFSACTHGSMQGLQERFVNGFVTTHNSMADAEKLHPQAGDAATGGQYALAVEKMTEAKADAAHALISNPTAVVAEMQEQNAGVSEGKVVDLLSARITSFIDGAEHILKAMNYAQQGDMSGYNQEVDLGNAAFDKSWQAEYALQDLVRTDANLSYLRQAVGW